MSYKPTAEVLNAEDNERAVFLSEEVDFLEGLQQLINSEVGKHPEWDHSTLLAVKSELSERIDIVKEALISVPVGERANPGDRAEEGITIPVADADEGIDWPSESEHYLAEDDLGPFEADDESEED